jgi:hypothetical protein
MAENYDKEFFEYLEKNFPAIHPNSPLGRDMSNVWDAAIKMLKEKFIGTNTDNVSIFKLMSWADIVLKDTVAYKSLELFIKQ